MITKLTPKQRELLNVYRDKWLEIGLSTDRIDRQRAIQTYNKFNDTVLHFKKNPVILFMDSPVGAWICVNLLWQITKGNPEIWSQVESQARSQVGEQVESQVRSQIREQVWLRASDQIWSQIASQIASQIGSQVASQVASQIGSQIASQIGSQVGSQIRSQIEEQDWSQVESQVRSQVYPQIWSQVASQAKAQIVSQIKDQLWSKIRPQVASQIRDQIWLKVWSWIDKQVDSQTSIQVESQAESMFSSFIYPYIDGHFSSATFAYYDYINKALGIKYDVQDKWDAYMATSEWGLCYPFDDFVVISEKPTALRFNDKKQLHADGKPAIEYADGFSVWALNGTRVPRWLVETPADKLDPAMVLKEENTEVRVEAVRKIGYDRLMHKLKGAVIDEQPGKDEYTLLEFKNIFSVPMKVLKMKCPSSRDYHYIPVDPKCKTVKGALYFYYGNKEYKIVEAS